MRVEVLGFTADITTFDCTVVGPNIVTLTVEDNNGNTSTCAEVTIEDNVPPMALCDDLTVILDGNGTVNISAGELDGGSTRQLCNRYDFHFRSTSLVLILVQTLSRLAL